MSRTAIVFTYLKLDLFFLPFMFVGIYFVFVLKMCFLSLATTIFIIYLHSRSNAVPPSPMPPRVSQLYTLYQKITII